jgi:hypothetical protein
VFCIETDGKSEYNKIIPYMYQLFAHKFGWEKLL